MIALALVIFGVIMIALAYYAIFIGVRFWLHIVKITTDNVVLRGVLYGLTGVFFTAFTLFMVGLVVFII